MPYSPNYQGTGPRILKVSLLKESMVDALLETWKLRKRVLPPALKLRTFSSQLRAESGLHTGPRVDLTQANTNTADTAVMVPMTSTESFSKNGCQLTPLGQE